MLSVGVEARPTLEIAKTIISPDRDALPDASSPRTRASLQAIGYEFDTAALDEVSELLAALKAAIGALEAALAHDHRRRCSRKRATSATSWCRPSLAVREAGDALEADRRRRSVAARVVPGDAVHSLSAVPGYEEVHQRAERRAGAGDRVCAHLLGELGVDPFDRGPARARREPAAIGQRRPSCGGGRRGRVSVRGSRARRACRRAARRAASRCRGGG